MPHPQARSRFITAAVVLTALAIALLCLRDWSVRAPRSHPLAALSAWWPGHPRMKIEGLMVESARSAVAGRSLDDAAREDIRKIVRKAPLAHEPFLLEGAVAQLEGRNEQAERLYAAARQRDPRDASVRILLADLELRQGQVREGLGDLVAIARVAPKMSAPVVPALTAYARSPGAAARMRDIFAANQNLAGEVLNQLAADPANAPIILALAPDEASRAWSTPWQQRLVESTFAASRGEDARRLWARFNRVGDIRELPYNPSFQKRSAGPPFNWQLFSSGAGVAELAPGGGLSIMHYGREPMLLARQALVPKPGSYAIRAAYGGSPLKGRLSWRLQCIGASLPPSNAPGEGGTLTVPDGCTGAWLELHASPGETEQRLETTLRRVELRKVG